MTARKYQKKIRTRLLVIVCLVLVFTCGLLAIKILAHKELDQPTIEAFPSVPCKVHMNAVGDILMEEGIYDWLGEDFDFKDYFDDVKPILNGEVMFMNQEALVGGEEFGICKDNYTFNTSQKVAQQLTNLGFNLVSIANNHCMDMGMEGVANTLDFWRQYQDLVYAGMYDSKTDRESLRILEKNGIKFGFLAYTSFTNKDVEENDSFEIVPYCENLDTDLFEKPQQEMIQRDIERIRPQCDVLVVSMHWGDEGSFEVSDVQRETADFLNQCGVDIILGHHPHIMQPCDWIENAENGHRTFVAYSLGNFISSDPDVDANTDEGSAYTLSSILSLDILKKDNQISIENVTYTPLVNHFDSDNDNYHLYPLWLYTEHLASNHARSYYNDEPFSLEWIKNQVNEVMDNGTIKIQMTK